MVSGNEMTSVRRQCALLDVSRSTVAYKPLGESPLNLKLMLEIDKIMTISPSSGSRMLADILSMELNMDLNRKRIQRLMRMMGIEAIYPKKRTTLAGKSPQIFPYLLKDLAINRPNQVWCTDITYLPMRGGFMYLVAVMDWYSRKILSWEISNTMDVSFCLEAFEKAIRSTGCVPEIFNTDQGSQFTSEAWISQMRELKIKPSSGDTPAKIASKACFIIVSLIFLL
jgi:putative transposase